MAPNEESIGGIYIYFISAIRLYKFTKLTWFRTPHGRLVCVPRCWNGARKNLSLCAADQCSFKSLMVISSTKTSTSS